MPRRVREFFTVLPVTDSISLPPERSGNTSARVGDEWWSQSADGTWIRRETQDTDESKPDDHATIMAIGSFGLGVIIWGVIIAAIWHWWPEISGAPETTLGRSPFAATVPECPTRLSNHGNSYRAGNALAEWEDAVSVSRRDCGERNLESEWKSFILVEYSSVQIASSHFSGTPTIRHDYTSSLDDCISDLHDKFNQYRCVVSEERSVRPGRFVMIVNEQAPGYVVVLGPYAPYPGMYVGGDSGSAENEPTMAKWILSLSSLK